MFDTPHAHITAWVIGLILFVVALFLYQSGKQKGFKIAQMSLRLFYLLIIATGVMLFVRHSSFDPALYGIKFLAGIIVIAMMEMILIRTSKGKATGILWIIFIVSFVGTFLLGVKLPLGWNWLG
jgi:hypothetical protein